MDEGQRTSLQPRPVRTVRRLRVRLVEGPDAGTIAEAPVVSVGASADCQLVLRDPAVSRYHLELRHGPEGITVTDLGSRNGTWLGGVRLERAVVPAGTRLALGASALLVEDAGSGVDEEDPRVELPGVVATSEAMRQVARLVGRLGRVQTSVLIEGETGVGKEVVARAIHEAGARSGGPFVVVDCGSLPPTLIASQLFGHERGAFTGADARRLGAFERAQGGTLLLDEIGELPLELQPALLGVLERRRFSRVGGAADVEADVRVLAATNRDLRVEVNAGTFRADLYYRLAVARVLIPPLRERPEDIEPMVASFVEKLTGVPGEHPLAADMDALRKHRWSGNVRELRNVVEAALVMGRVELAEGAGAAPMAAAVAGAGAPLDAYRDARADALHHFEVAYLSRLLRECGGNVSEAARRAKMDRPYLSTLVKKHALR